ncbi:protein GRAVITROPIC IN THE LIGHT [Trifolium repens]|nr:protein GRAVITROPIC IN THE LIGHT [Trifolium repens]
METVKPKSAMNNRSKKFAKTFQKVISLKSATKIASNNGICMLNSNLKVKEDHFTDHHIKTNGNNKNKARNKAVMEALIARLFAGVTTIKASYAELQMAQQPYNNDSIQAADQAVVDELRAISELKKKFLKKELNLSPQVTIMLAEIQEQQSIMKTYEITIKKLQGEVDAKESQTKSLRKKLDECISFNKSLEKKLNSNASLSLFVNLELSMLNHTHFVYFLHYTLRSIRTFVKLMIEEMESANWDVEAAVKFIHPNAVFNKPSHRCFAFESFVSITMFESFNYPNFIFSNDPLHNNHQNHYFDKFKRLRSLNPKQYLENNPNSSFAKFLKSKYLQLVHAKMECSLFGNLNQRKLVNSGGYPDSAFFLAFAEMAKRVWTLHYLAFSFQENITIFQVKKNTRFSEVYMESVTEESVSTTSSSVDSAESNSGEFRVVFTVVPGFKIGKTVIQSKVYLCLVDSPSSS